MRDWTRYVLEMVLPPGVRVRTLKKWDKLAPPPARVPAEAAAIVVADYKKQAIAAFNKYAYVVQIPLAFFCFGMSK
jgi:hypothetical protein